MSASLNDTSQIGPFLTRRMVWQKIVDEIGVPCSWRYFEQLCMRGKGPVASRRYGKQYLYTEDAPAQWANSYLKSGDKAAA